MLIPLSTVEEVARLSFRQTVDTRLPNRMVEQGIRHLFRITIHDRFGFSPELEDIDVRWRPQEATDQRTAEVRWRRPVSNQVAVMGEIWQVSGDAWSPYQPIAAVVAGSGDGSTHLRCRGWDTELRAWSYS